MKEPIIDEIGMLDGKILGRAGIQELRVNRLSGLGMNAVALEVEAPGCRAEEMKIDRVLSRLAQSVAFSWTSARVSRRAELE